MVHNYSQACRPRFESHSGHFKDNFFNLKWFIFGPFISTSVNIEEKTVNTVRCLIRLGLMPILLTVMMITGHITNLGANLSHVSKLGTHYLQIPTFNLTDF